MSPARHSLVIVGAGPRGTGLLERIAANASELYGSSGDGSGGPDGSEGSTSISSTPIRRAAAVSGARRSHRCCG